MSVLYSWLQRWIGSQLSFCATLKILHFSCEIKQDVQLANCDTFLSDMVMYFETVIFLSGDLLPGILYPYSKKVSSIRVMPSTWEKYKVLFTWASHLSVLSLLYCMSFACTSDMLSHFSCVRLCVTPQTAAHQAPPSLGFSRQEHWSGLPFPFPMHESEKWKWSRSVVSDS